MVLTATAGVLRQMHVFRGLCDDDLKSLADLCRWREYYTGDQIILHDDRSTDIYFVARGTVRATIYSSNGKEIVLRDFTSGEMFGELAAIDGEPRSAHVIAIENCLIASMTAEVFQKARRKFPEMTEATMKQLTQQVRRLCTRVFEFSAYSVNKRIRAELLRLATGHKENGSVMVISPVPKHADIASKVSTHREAVTRELKELEQIGVIERSKDQLIIRDPDRLAKMAQEDLIGL
ncbi:MAG: Crp/Fnr family transcriptional regulator [Gammaproteobacteria bacterium]|nr:Crp/Fnr family transcriptional regulator [Gammaproteobacteria bacterium]